MSAQPAGSAPIRVVLQAVDDGADAEDLDELALELRDEIAGLHLDGLDAVRLDEVAAEDDWSDTRAIEQTIGIVLVTLASPKLMTVLLATIRAWMGGRAGRSVEISLNQHQSVRVTGDLSARNYEKLVKAALSSLPPGTDQD